MITRKRVKLFPIIFKYRKYGLEFRLVGNCCNLDYYVMKWWLLAYFAFFDKYYWRCSQCGKLHCIEMQYHFTPYYDVDLREENKRLGDFRNGKI